jgi:hypothetical protein
MKGLLEEKSWDEFRQTGLLWFVNSILHTFGWAITCECDDNTLKVQRVYPARTTFRGFDPADELDARQRVSAFLMDNASELYSEAEWPVKDEAK